MSIILPACLYTIENIPYHIPTACLSSLSLSLVFFFFSPLLYFLSLLFLYFLSFLVLFLKADKYDKLVQFSSVHFWI